jgi:hypothetical protein
VWIFFYAAMVLLIIKYRTKPSLLEKIADLLRRRQTAESSWW